MTSSNPAPRRILYICDFNAHGGTQTHVIHLLEGLDRRRFAPSLVTLNLDPGLGERVVRAGGGVHDLGLKGALRLSTLRAVLALARRIRAEKPDLLHGFLYQGNILTVLLSWMTGVPCLTSVRNRDIWKKRRHRFVSGLAHKRALRVVFNSTRVRDETMAAEGIPATRSAVIANGVPDLPVSSAVQLDRTPGTILCVASLRLKKGHTHLLEAFRQVLIRAPQARLLIAGDGPMRRHLSEMAASFAPAGAVRFVGYEPDIASLLRQSDLFVLASLEEGMPNALLEAMAASLPAVVTAVGGNPEVIQDGVTGWLVPAEDSVALAARIIELLERPSMMAAMGQAARRRFEDHFSLRRMLDAYERLYADLDPELGRWTQR